MKILDVKMDNCRSTYLSSIAGVLRNANLWDDELYMLAGMTGLAFNFIIHEEACPSSVTVYDWVQEHTVMLDRIGISSEVFQNIYNKELNTFDIIQKKAICRIKESINNGKGVIVWAPTVIPEFGIIRGYDDNDKVFYINDYSNNNDLDPLLYKNLGKSEVSILSYQIIYEKKDVCVEKVIFDSLKYAIYLWEKENHTHVRYGSGRKGYENLIKTLRNDEQGFGLAYIIYIYSQYKEYIYKYLRHITNINKKFKGLKEAVILYKDVYNKYLEMEKLVPFEGPGTNIAHQNISQVLTLVKDCFKLEECAMEIIKDVINNG